LEVRCTRCGARCGDRGSLPAYCTQCATSLSKASFSPSYNYREAGEGLRRSGHFLFGHNKGLWRFRNLLPVNDERFMVSLGEGNTPVVSAPSTLGLSHGVDVVLKLEQLNPTLSYKDRHCCVSVSKALELGYSTVAVSSTGNHGISAAAYAARAGLQCLVLTSTKVPPAVLAQLEFSRATVLLTETMEQRWGIVQEGVRKDGWWAIGNTETPPAGVEPYGIEGYKTISFETFEQLGRVPDYLVCPVSFGDGLYGIWKGFWELVASGLADRTPKMVAVECSYGGALTNAIAKGLEEVEEVTGDESSVAFTLSVRNAPYHALKALRESEGTAITVDDRRILEAQRLLGTGGMYVEPASAVGVAGALRLRDEGYFVPGSQVLLVLTSAGVKHQDHVVENLKPLPVVQTYSEVARLLRR
jgi:threonine synthase